MPKNLSREILWVFFLVLLYVGYEAPHLNGGFHFEEARDASAYLAYTKGQLPYRDFEWMYGPFSYLIYPNVINFFGDSLLTLRTFYFVLVTSLIPYGYVLARQFLPVFWSGIFAFLSSAIFMFPSHTYNHVFLPLGLILSSFFLVRYLRSLNLFALALSGFFASVSLLAKPLSIGIIMFGSVFLFLVLEGRRKSVSLIKAVGTWGIGGLILPLALAVYFYLQTVGIGKPILFPPFFDSNSVAALEQAPQFEPLTLFHKVFLRPFKAVEENVRMGFGALLQSDALGVHLFGLEVYYNLFMRYFYLLLILVYFPLRWTLLRKTDVKALRRIDILMLLNVILALEGIITQHLLGKQYTLHLSFFLFALLFFMVQKATSSKKLVPVLGVLSALTIVSYTFFYLPLKHKLQDTEKLSWPRMSGIKVNPKEKAFLESVFNEWKIETHPKIAILGYSPHLAYLSGAEDIFANEQYVFLRLMALVERPIETSTEEKLKTLENHLVNKITAEDPKHIALFTNKKGQLAQIKERLPALTATFSNFDTTHTFSDLLGLQGAPAGAELILMTQASSLRNKPVTVLGKSD